MATIENLQKVIAALRDRAARSRKEDNVSVVVGYSASYAIFLHEMRNPVTLGKNIPRPSGLGFFWGPNGAPKFLEKPARQFSKEIGQIVRKALQEKKTMSQALLLGGLKLQRESQKLVPIEYNVLRSSAFCKLDPTYRK
jgi:hypothetical protein